MSSSLEQGVEALVDRFARDLAALVVRARISEVQALLQKNAGAPMRATVPDGRAWAQHYRLSPVETLILEAALVGQTRAQIAQERGTADVTIKRQISTLLKKTGDRSMLALVARIFRQPKP